MLEQKTGFQNIVPSIRASINYLCHIKPSIDRSIDQLTEKSIWLIFRRNVLEIYRSTGIENVGTVKWSIALCLMAVFFMVYFSLWKGIKSSGKVWSKETLPGQLTIIFVPVKEPISESPVRYPTPSKPLPKFDFIFSYMCDVLHWIPRKEASWGNCFSL